MIQSVIQKIYKNHYVAQVFFYFGTICCTQGAALLIKHLKENLSKCCHTSLQFHTYLKCSISSVTFDVCDKIDLSTPLHYPI